MFRQKPPEVVYIVEMPSSGSSVACSELAQLFVEYTTLHIAAQYLHPIRGFGHCHIALEHERDDGSRDVVSLFWTENVSISITHERKNGPLLTPDDRSTEFGSRLASIVREHYPGSQARQIKVYSSLVGP